MQSPPASSRNNENKESQMRRFKLLGLALMAVLIAAVAVVGTASAALPKILPESGVARNWTGSNTGNVEVLGSGIAVICTEAPAIGTQEANKPLGSFHIELKNCTSEKGAVKCTGLGDSAGVILVLGMWHSVFDNLSSLSAAMLFLLEKVHFNCTVLILVLVSGELVCLWLRPTESAATHSFHCVATSAGKQEEEAYFNEAGTEVKAALMWSFNEAEAKPFVMLTLDTQTFSEAVSADI
jgi:hypothetical protein